MSAPYPRLTRCVLMACSEPTRTWRGSRSTAAVTCAIVAAFSSGALARSQASMYEMAS